MANERYTYLTPDVYDRCMSRSRTNIEIEDDYVRAIMDRYGVHTKTEAVDLALRHLAGQPMTRDEALAMRGAHAIEQVPDDTRPPEPCSPTIVELGRGTSCSGGDGSSWWWW